MQNCSNGKNISHLKKKAFEIGNISRHAQKTTQNETVKIVHKSKSMSFSCFGEENSKYEQGEKNCCSSHDI